MQAPRTRNERKQQIPNYLNEEQLLQELQYQAKQKQKQKQFEELQEKEDLLKHMQNYQMGGEENRELEEFLQKKITELRRENDKLGNENFQIYNQLQQSPTPSSQHPNYNFLPPKQQTQQNQQKTQSEIEREKRLKLRQEERQRRLLGIQASVYDSNNPNLPEQAQFIQQQSQQNQFHQQQQNQYLEQFSAQLQQSPIPQFKQNLKQNSSNISSILHGYEKQSIDSSSQNKDILSNYVIGEQGNQQLKQDNKQQQQKQLPNIVSNKDKQQKYKEELDQQIAQKRSRIQSAHPYYHQQQQQSEIQTPGVKQYGGVLPNQPQDESLKKLQELEKKRKYADELKKQMQEKKQPSNLQNQQKQQNIANIPTAQNYQNNQMVYQDSGFRENNQNYLNGVVAQMNFPLVANQENDTEKQKAIEQEKKRQYRDELLQQMQEQQQQKTNNNPKKRNITSARVQSQNSFPVQPCNQNESECFQQQMQVDTPIQQNKPNYNRQISKKITREFEDEEQLKKKQNQQQEYQEILKRQIEEQNRKKLLEKQKLKEEEERAEKQMEIQRQQMKDQLLQQKDEGNQKISRRKRVNNQFINQNLETIEQIALKEQTTQQNQIEPIGQNNEIAVQQQLQVDLQTQNLSQNLVPEQKTPQQQQYIQPIDNYSQNLIAQNQQQYIQQPNLIQPNQQQFFSGSYQNEFQQFQQPIPQFYQNQQQCLIGQQQQQQLQMQYQPQQQFQAYQNLPQMSQQQFWANQAQDQIQTMNNQILQQKVNIELQMQKEAMSNLQNQMQQLVEMYKNQITDIMGQKGTTDQQITQLKQIMEDKFNNPIYSFSEMNSVIGQNAVNNQQQQQLQQQKQQQISQNNSKKYWSKKDQQPQQLLQVAEESQFKYNPSSILQQSLLPFSSDYVQPESNVMEQSYQKDLLLFEKLNKNKESFAKQFEELQQKEQQLTEQINEKEEFLRQSQHRELVSKQNDSLQIPKDFDQKLSKVVNADYSYFDQKRKQKKDEKQFDELKEALLSEESEQEIDQSFEAANLSEIKKQENEVKLGAAQFQNEQNSLVLQDEEAMDQQNSSIQIRNLIQSQVNEDNQINFEEDEEINNRSELNIQALDQKLIQEFNDVRKSGKPLIDEEIKAKLEKLSIHGSAEKEKSIQEKQFPQEQKRNYGKPKTFDIFGQIEKQNSYMLTKNKEKQEQILTRLDKFIEEAMEEVGDDYDEMENNSDDQQMIDTQELYQEVKSIEKRNKLAFKDARKSCESQRYQEDDEDDNNY